MIRLPIEQVIPDIRQALGSGNRLVLVAPPGAGKTTRVPLALLDEPWLAGRMIIMLEPRRLAARTAAARMAATLGENTGATVGYRIRAESASSARTRILVVTEGILTRMLQADPELAAAALVIFDEFHERNLHADLALAFCLQSQELLRPDLKLLVMSATLDAAGVARLLGDAPVVTSAGQSFPVETAFLPDRAPLPEPGRISAAVLHRLERVLAEESGSVLVFLPGVREIRQVEHALGALQLAQTDNAPIVAPLYGDLSREQQDRALQPCATGRRKVVLATNIAETSLTIEGIAIVIDSGLERQARFDPGAGMNRLETVFISRDSADQRSGRAGRLGPGKCYRLWTPAQQQRMARHGIPEILRSDLAPLALELANWGVRETGELHWLDPPNAGALAQARELLQALGAIDERFGINVHGRQLLETGAHPRLAHMMIRAAQAGHGFAACLLAALLTERDILAASGARSADVAPRLALLQAFRQDAGAATAAGVNRQQCRRVLRAAEDFHRRIRRHEQPAGAEAITAHDLPGVLLAWAYPERIGRSRHAAGNRYLLRSGKGAYLDEGEALASAEFIVAADLDGRAREARIYLAAEITLQQIEAHLNGDITRDTHVSWNAQTQSVDAVTRTCLGAIVLEQQPAVDIGRAAVHAALIKGIRQCGLDCLPWDKRAQTLRQRIQFLRLQRQSGAITEPELATLNLPDLSDTVLLDHLEDWLQPYLDAHNSIRKLQALDLHAILSGHLSHAQQQALERLAPTHVAVPSGSRIAIDYSDADQPVLAVRLQELFGLQQTPAIINGRFKLLLHLLSPGYKPMQVTQDLASFWKTAYFEVRKELRGRYKKHHWPEDPLTAPATSRAKRRGETSK
ncbi:MAG: ATP-dependent helicase HrpB [Pseudomonadota bacterium]